MRGLSFVFCLAVMVSSISALASESPLIASSVEEDESFNFDYYNGDYGGDYNEDYSGYEASIGSEDSFFTEPEIKVKVKEDMMVVRDGSDTHLLIPETSEGCTPKQISEFVERHKIRYFGEKHRASRGTKSCGLRKDQLSGLTYIVSEPSMTLGERQGEECLVNLQILSHELSVQLLKEHPRTRKTAQGAPGLKNQRVLKGASQAEVAGREKRGR